MRNITKSLQEEVSVVTTLDIIKDISFVTSETKAIHKYPDKYVKFEPRGENAGYLRNEDMDETKGEKPDYDHDEPICYIELFPDKFKITIITYGGRYHVDIFYKEQLLFAGVGGTEQRHRGGFKEVQLVPEVPAPAPDLSSIVSLLGDIKNLLAKEQLPITHLYYHKDDIDTPTIEGSYLPEHNLHLNADLGRNVSVLYIYNDGPGDLYFEFSTNGVDFSVEESVIYPGERQILYNINWIRLRSNVAGTFYRLSEYEVDKPDRVNISQIQNLAIPIINSSFELGDLTGWSYSGNGSVAVDSTVKNTGSYSAKVSVDAAGTFDLWNTELIPTMPKRAILVSGYVRAEDISKVYFLARYFTEDGNQLPSPANDNITYEALFGYDKYLEGLSSSAFTRKLRETSAPAGAAFYQVGIRVVGAGTAGTVYLDDISLPTFLDGEPQFRWQIVTLLPRYILPGQTITLHESGDGEVGEVLYFNVTVSLDDAVFYIYYDNEVVTLPVSIILEDAPNVAAAYCMEIDESDADPLKWRYYVAVTPATLIKYNYRQKVTLSNPLLTFRKALQEQIGTGNGVATTFAGALTNPLVYTGTLCITDGVEVFTDNYDGTLTGSAGGTGVIDYTTGVYSVTFNTAPVNLVAIYAGYYYFIFNITVLYFDGGAIYKKIRI